MNKRMAGFIIAAICYTAVIAGAFCLIGYKAAYYRMEQSAHTLIPQTFYATISDIQDRTFTVTGMEVNDINFRGEFLFTAAETTKVTWRHTDILPEDLDVGDSVSITFTGDILESYPAQIQQVEMIQLLDDEK